MLPKIRDHHVWQSKQCFLSNLIHPSEIRHGFDDDEKEAIDKKEKKPVGTTKKYIIQYLSIYEEVVDEKEKKVIGTSKKVLEEEEKEDTGLLR